MASNGYSPHVQELLDQVTPQQRGAIPRLAISIIEGRGVEPLLRGEGKVCNHWTYWRRAKAGQHSDGWAHQPRFKSALDAVVGEMMEQAEADVVAQSVARIRRRLRLHDRWADLAAELGIEAGENLAQFMRGEMPPKIRDDRVLRAMVQAAKALFDREARLYEQDKSRADKLLAEKESAAAAVSFLQVMQLGIASAEGEEGVSGSPEWSDREDLAELGVQDETVESFRVLAA